MTDEGGQATAVRLDEFLPYPPSRVWHALTDPAKMANWLMANDFRPVVGHRFTFRTEPVPGTDFDGVVSCEVLAVEPERLLRISWAGGPAMRTTVTWRLAAEGRGTRLFLDHEGFDPTDPAQMHALRIMAGGWRTHMVRRLSAVLAGS